MKEANDYLETEMLEALERLQLAYQVYLASYEGLANSTRKRGLLRPGGQARLRVLTQYAELLNSKIELALESRIMRDRLGYILEKRKYDKRSGSIHDIIERLRTLQTVLPRGSATRSVSLQPKRSPVQRPPIHVEPMLPEARSEAAPPLPVKANAHPVIRLQVPELPASSRRPSPPKAAASERNLGGTPMIRLSVPELTPVPKRSPMTDRQTSPSSSSSESQMTAHAPPSALSGHPMPRISSPTSNRPAASAPPVSTKPLLFTSVLKAANRHVGPR